MTVLTTSSSSLAVILSARLLSTSTHYNKARPHRSLKLDAPVSFGEPNCSGVVCRNDVLGGIVHEYERAA